MILTKMSLLIFSVFVAVVWVFIPTQYSYADREVETYSSSSDTDSVPEVESEHRYEQKSEHWESNEVANPPEREYDRTDIERDRPVPGVSVDVPFFHFGVH
jgi:hypothetical protein